MCRDIRIRCTTYRSTWRSQPSACVAQSDSPLAQSVQCVQANNPRYTTASASRHITASLRASVFLSRVYISCWFSWRWLPLSFASAVNLVHVQVSSVESRKKEMYYMSFGSVPFRCIGVLRSQVKSQQAARMLQSSRPAMGHATPIAGCPTAGCATATANCE